MTKEKKEWVVWTDSPELFDVTPEDYKKYLEKMQEKEVEVIDAVEVVNDILTEELNNATEGIVDGDLADEMTEFTEEQKREIYITKLKLAKIKFHPFKYLTKIVKTEKIVSPLGGSYHRTVVEKSNETVTNVIVSQFGKSYKEKRRKKNKEVRKSRKANR